MTRKPFAAFGRILYANYYDKGEVFNLNTSVTSRTTLFFSSGDLIAKDKNTDEVVHVCKPGWFAGSHKDSDLVCTALEPTVCWCYDPLVNQGYLPNIQAFTNIRGQRTMFNSFTNLFLCEGTVMIDQNTYTGPYQLAIKNDKRVVLCSTDAYGLLFK